MAPSRRNLANGDVMATIPSSQSTNSRSKRKKFPNQEQHPHQSHERRRSSQQSTSSSSFGALSASARENTTANKMHSQKEEEDTKLSMSYSNRHMSDSSRISVSKGRGTSAFRAKKLLKAHQASLRSLNSSQEQLQHHDRKEEASAVSTSNQATSHANPKRGVFRDSPRGTVDTKSTISATTNETDDILQYEHDCHDESYDNFLVQLEAQQDFSHPKSPPSQQGHASISNHSYSSNSNGSFTRFVQQTKSMWNFNLKDEEQRSQSPSGKNPTKPAIVSRKDSVEADAEHNVSLYPSLPRPVASLNVTASQSPVTTPASTSSKDIQDVGEKPKTIARENSKNTTALKEFKESHVQKMEEWKSGHRSAEPQRQQPEPHPEKQQHEISIFELFEQRRRQRQIQGASVLPNSGYRYSQSTKTSKESSKPSMYKTAKNNCKPQASSPPNVVAANPKAPPPLSDTAINSWMKSHSATCSDSNAHSATSTRLSLGKDNVGVQLDPSRNTRDTSKLRETKDSSKESGEAFADRASSCGSAHTPKAGWSKGSRASNDSDSSHQQHPKENLSKRRSNASLSMDGSNNGKGEGIKVGRISSPCALSPSSSRDAHVPEDNDGQIVKGIAYMSSLGLSEQSVNDTTPQRRFFSSYSTIQGTHSADNQDEDSRMSASENDCRISRISSDGSSRPQIPSRYRRRRRARYLDDSLSKEQATVSSVDSGVLPGAYQLAPGKKLQKNRPIRKSVICSHSMSAHMQAERFSRSSSTLCSNGNDSSTFAFDDHESEAKGRDSHGNSSMGSSNIGQGSKGIRKTPNLSQKDQLVRDSTHIKISAVLESKRRFMKNNINVNNFYEPMPNYADEVVNVQETTVPGTAATASTATSEENSDEKRDSLTNRKMAAIIPLLHDFDEESDCVNDPRSHEERSRSPTAGVTRGHDADIAPPNTCYSVKTKSSNSVSAAEQAVQMALRRDSSGPADIDQRRRRPASGVPKLVDQSHEKSHQSFLSVLTAESLGMASFDDSIRSPGETRDEELGLHGRRCDEEEKEEIEPLPTDELNASFVGPLRKIPRRGRAQGHSYRQSSAKRGPVGLDSGSLLWDDTNRKWSLLSKGSTLDASRSSMDVSESEIERQISTFTASSGASSVAKESAGRIAQRMSLRRQWSSARVGLTSGRNLPVAATVVDCEQQLEKEMREALEQEIRQELEIELEQLRRQLILQVVGAAEPVTANVISVQKDLSEASLRISPLDTGTNFNQYVGCTVQAAQDRERAEAAHLRSNMNRELGRMYMQMKQEKSQSRVFNDEVSELDDLVATRRLIEEYKYRILGAFCLAIMLGVALGAGVAAAIFKS